MVVWVISGWLSMVFGKWVSGSQKRRRSQRVTCLWCMAEMVIWFIGEAVGW